MTEINITPNHRVLYERFFREFEDSIKVAIREATVTELRDDLKPLRDTAVFLNIAIQSIDSLELLADFRTRLQDVVSTLVGAHDKMIRDAEPIPGPEEGDLVTYDDKYFFSVGSYSYIDVRLRRNYAFTVGDDEDRDVAIRRYMNQQQFWPDAWSIPDHGDAHLIDLSEVKS